MVSDKLLTTPFPAFIARPSCLAKAKSIWTLFTYIPKEINTPNHLYFCLYQLLCSSLFLFYSAIVRFISIMKFLTQLARYVHWCKSGIIVMGLTKHFLAGFKTYFTVQNQFLELLWGQKPMVRQITHSPWVRTSWHYSAKWTQY